MAPRRHRSTSDKSRISLWKVRGGREKFRYRMVRKHANKSATKIRDKRTNYRIARVQSVDRRLNAKHVQGRQLDQVLVKGNSSRRCCWANNEDTDEHILR